MVPNNSRPSETSPLLPKPDDNAHCNDPVDNVAPISAHTPDGNEQDGGDIERQVSNGDSFKHQGLPEVRKRMKYIFPAIAIGVSTFHYCILFRYMWKD
jgi:hypothetical protein